MIQFSKLQTSFYSLVALLAIPSVAIAEPMTVTVNLTSTQGVGVAVGVITLEDTGYGLLLTPDLKGLASGIHGFHIHTNPSCEPAEKDGEIVAGLGAGGHFDPLGTGYHAGPYGDGHLGDLPPLYRQDGHCQCVYFGSPR